MTKFFGKIGYAMTQETKPGVWTDQIIEHEYYGDLLRNSYRFQTSDKVNDDVLIANEFSIIADSFAKDNFHLMRYIEFEGTKWKITNVEVRYPRLNLTVGGIYNENQI